MNKSLLSIALLFVIGLFMVSCSKTTDFIDADEELILKSKTESNIHLSEAGSELERIPISAISITVIDSEKSLQEIKEAFLLDELIEAKILNTRDGDVLELNGVRKGKEVSYSEMLYTSNERALCGCYAPRWLAKHTFNSLDGDSKTTCVPCPYYPWELY